MILSSGPRRAFAAIRALVVAAAFVGLLGVLGPAVVKSRAAAARVRTINNLREIGLSARMAGERGRGGVPDWEESPPGASAPLPAPPP
jgi:hypothetical protein